MKIYPVNPSVLQDGTLLSLRRFLDREKSVPVALEEGDDPFTSFKISQSQVSLKAAANLDVSTVFKGNFEFSDIGLVFDAIAYTDKYLSEDSDDMPVIMTRWGAGLRVAIKVTDIKSNIDASFASIAASSQLNNAKASYEIIGMGLGIGALTEVLDDLPPLGDFGLDAYAKLTTGVYGALKKYLERNQAELTPVPVAVGLHGAISTDPLEDARDIYLAMYQRNRGKDIDYVIDRYPEIDKELIRLVFDLTTDQARSWLSR